MATRFPITLNQLTYFSVCATTLNMTVASQELLVAQSAVSTAITQLERALGTSLFIRKHAKGLVLTPAGEQLQRETHRLFEHLETALDSIQTGATEVQGTVRLAVFDAFAPTILPGIIDEAHRRHPRLTVEVLEGNYAQNLETLRSGRADLALTYAFGEAPDVITDTLKRALPYVLVSEQHRLSGANQVRLSDLDGESMILLDLPDSRDYFLDLLETHGASPVVRHRTANFEAVRSMVSAGMGFSILHQRPKFDTTYAGGRAIQLEIADTVPGLPVALIKLRQTHTSARVRSLAEAARSVVGVTQQAE